MLLSFLLFALHALGAEAVNSFVFTTTSDGNCTLSECGQISPAQGTGDAGSLQPWDLTVDESTTKQTIVGFGAAVTDGTVAAYNTLSESEQEGVLKWLFTTDGANFNLVRHTIGASDLSDSIYSYDDNDGDKTDLTLPSFTIGTKGAAMATFLANVKSNYNSELKVVGSPWSAPSWMKNPDNTFNGPTYVPHYINYFLKYITAFKASSGNVVNIDAMTIQNEPLNNNTDSLTMVVSDTDARDFINNFAPTLEKQHPETDIWAYDHNTDNPWYPTTVVTGAGSNPNLKAVAWHCYTSRGPNTVQPDWTALSDSYRDTGLSQYMSECWTPTQDPSRPTIGWYWASNFTLGPLQNWASGIMSWPLGSDNNVGDFGPHLNTTGACRDCKGLFTADPDSGTAKIQNEAYQMAQYSRYMARGSQVRDVTGCGGPIQAVSSYNPADGSKTVVIQNTETKSYWMRVHFSASGGVWSGVIKPLSVTTWYFTP